MPSFPRLPQRAVALTAVLASMTACDKKPSEQRRGPPPPPIASARSNACAHGGGTLSDSSAATFFPRTLRGYCIDPLGETRVYGKRAPKDLDAICTEAFNGDCEVYKSFGLERVVIFRYVDGTGSSGAIDVVLSKYASAEGAYGMFTKRVISEGDPAREGAPRPMKVSGIGALGTAAAYLYKSQIVVELTYTNDQQTPKQLEASANTLLSALAATITQKLPAPDSPPAAAARLPKDGRIPLGVRFEPKDAFGVRGGGAGAIGYYRSGKKRYRILSILREDEPQAKDVLSTLLRREGAKRLEDVGHGAVRIMVGDVDGPRAEWIVGRKGRRVLGIGDESLVLRPGMSPSERDALRLTRGEKIERLNALLSK